MNTLPEIRMCQDPDRIVVFCDPGDQSDVLAAQAVDLARSIMPKVTGTLAASLRPISGPDWFGIYFPDRRVWFLEQGTRPFTMRSLAGRLIPMWVENPSPAEKRNPKTKTRVTLDGRHQWLIFRRVGVKNRGRIKDGARYPGQPGRITRREASQPLTTAGRQGGRIAKGNVGVAWRNPGLVGRQFLNYAVSQIAEQEGLEPESAYLVDAASFFPLVRA